MHKIKIKIKRLKLNAQCIRHLTTGHLRHAAGGKPYSGPLTECCVSPYQGCTSYDTCTVTTNCQTAATNCEVCP